jgi:lipopolysaccharide transport system permease protein
MYHKRIEPNKGFKGINFKELIEFRDLLAFFIWRDIKIRYKQTKIGVFWILFQPILYVIIFTLFFGYVLKVPSDGVPYALFFYTGYLPWMLCGEGISRATVSIISNSSVISKVYFPRIYMPLYSVLTPVIDFVVASLILIALMVIYGYSLTWRLLLIPVVVLLIVIVTFSVGLILATLNTRYRDFQNFLPYVLQLWSYASPMVYSITLIPLFIRDIYILNPLVFVIEFMRWIVIGEAFPPLTHALSFCVIFVVLIAGIILFKMKEHTFVDYV